MVFWVGILIGALFAWFAIKIGFYEIWTLLFNIIISIYLAIFLGPIIMNIVPASGDAAYSTGLTILATAIGAFLILHGISYVFLTSQFSFSFPKILDTLGSGLLGFLAGLLVWSFAGLLICATPISQNAIVKEIGFSRELQQANISYICWWCNLVNAVVSSRDNKLTTEQAISGLLDDVEKKTKDKAVKPAEPNEPAEPNDVKPKATIKEPPGTPPEVDTEDI